MTDSTTAVLAWLLEYRGPQLPPLVDGYLREHRQLEAKVVSQARTVSWFEQAICLACVHHNRGGCAVCAKPLGRAA